MMVGNRRLPIDKATQDEQSLPAELDPYADTLAMPQEDDPAGDGHMWSGKTTTTEDRPEDESEVGASGHLPTHQTDPLQF
jgi:hypothetical protein